MTGSEARSSFLDFFRKNGHSVVPSDSLIPRGDPSLLFTSAGMVQFKPYFLGLKTGLKRAASCQKSFRTTDIDRVGVTLRHLTFFEMLGNFSFGDYFKKETIAWGWEYLTKELGLDPARLYISIYGGGSAPGDDEAKKIWNSVLPPGLRTGRIKALGDDSNFWNMGATGPCGPCSEIYWDRGPEFGHPGCFGVGCDCDRYTELWNHVFTQFDRQDDGSYKPLPCKNIDTGMSLERLAFVVEGKLSPFETDLFSPIVSAASGLLGRAPDESEEAAMAFRVIADHARACVFLSGEGITPSNDGRGYVLRRLIRRALRYGRLLGCKNAFLHRLVPGTMEIFGKTYPGLPPAKTTIEETICSEEERFLETLENGEKLIQELLERHPKELPGGEVFRLYETYGFPPELTKEIAAKHGRSLDVKGLEDARLKAQKTAKAGWKGSGQKETLSFQKAESAFSETCFTGYEANETKTRVLGLLDASGKIVDILMPEAEGYLVLEQTPFYAESGGQTGDSGEILSPTGARLADVSDTQRPLSKVIFHRITARRELRKGTEVLARVYPLRRAAACNHTATHLVNAALKQVLGKGVRQAGSLVTPERFRFDYTVSKPPTKDELARIEEAADKAVRQGYAVSKAVRPLRDAEKLGAVTLPGEKYSDPARFVLINEGSWDNVEEKFSLELCGGIHVDNTAELITVRIIRDSSVAAGTRRIEGVAGPAAVGYLRQSAAITERMAHKLRVIPEETERRIDQLIQKEKSLRQEINDLKQKMVSGASAARESEAIELGSGAKLVTMKVDDADMGALREVSDRLKAENKNSIFFLASVKEDKLSFVVSVSPDRKDKTPDAATLAKAIAQRLGGSAGGRPDFAQGGGNSPENWEDLVREVAKLAETV
ncbi:MAG: alanine--tRNA ligase [bacterium]